MICGPNSRDKDFYIDRKRQQIAENYLELVDIHLALNQSELTIEHLSIAIK
jgi:hypothetical protein